MPATTQETTPIDLDSENKPEQSADRLRIRVLAGASDTAASFQFDDEDHTLGNALRYIIHKNPDVEFCGYSIPHPSEAKMNLRIQTYDGASVYTVLEKGLEDLMAMCDIVEQKYTIARDEFASKMQE
ncbi:RPB11 DNA-directed RNA polymerase subunit L [Pyrenophora tritici-repentis]|uniref:DNA-directed RNA polymerases I and III subunit RPAC2 n=2 Tax=Pyrenophora tritici-repentis TaxID=45151 RepID=A0A2W1E4I4_9PLEO|nr:DNA-directed RNA polymerase I and III 14 KDA polypeptide [Pyrenophora tritici-repentis Pt-1C-BFP]KAA8625801.1 dna-directed rna polymerase i and iii 14 kDa polypeptide protein [Pyrenophora tritici-repentis]EDU40608.1 DNA-directed RNA polymerase I and III 14 KDA polypeptide [Pyrenophora tritici-repentis Pt-1C-BFP]KAF7454218.1 dna-directed rna polymerase i and iii polypeptide protein [Pyrenophora tritici-repentis]KAF7577313.1 RPB11, DNA-directed RNA polymerase, subunit L [Pyrenophora tritici-re